MQVVPLLAVRLLASEDRLGYLELESLCEGKTVTEICY